MNPPMNIRKLIFYGSFVQSIRRGCIGGVFRDWFGMVVRSYSGPLESLDSNKAEVFASLLGYRELCRMGSFNAILECDSFSSIQWGSLLILRACLDGW